MGVQEIVEKLDKLYWTDIPGYTEYLQKIKGVGYKVFRNSKGKHKIESPFGGVFDKIFGGMK